jgi:hypothetical protein
MVHLQLRRPQHLEIQPERIIHLMARHHWGDTQKFFGSTGGLARQSQHQEQPKVRICKPLTALDCVVLD